MITTFCLFFFTSIQVRAYFAQDLTSSEMVCYEEAGCYSQTDPWVSVLRPFPPPSPPEEVDVGFYLLTRNTEEGPVTNYKVKLNNRYEPIEESLRSLHYQSSKFATVFVIHGFTASINSTWMSEMAEAYLSRVDANIFLVDWGKGANNASYLQTAANTRLVGFLISKFLKYLINRTHLTPYVVHIVGHSLGAHAGGYAAKSIRNIYRITGLDVAQIGFEGCPPEVRLNGTDATYLDILHTNAKPTIPTLGLGYVTPLGDVDFYFNGGYMQPGCVPIPIDSNMYSTDLDIATLPVEVISALFSCSHSKSIAYFIEAVRRTDCTMWGHQSNPLSTIMNLATFGLAQPVLDFFFGGCDINTCSPVGLYTFHYPARGKFYVTTAPVPEYCVPEW